MLRWIFKHKIPGFSTSKLVSYIFKLFFPLSNYLTPAVRECHILFLFFTYCSYLFILVFLHICFYLSPSLGLWTEKEPSPLLHNTSPEIMNKHLKKIPYFNNATNSINSHHTLLISSYVGCLGPEERFRREGPEPDFSW